VVLSGFSAYGQMIVEWSVDGSIRSFPMTGSSPSPAVLDEGKEYRLYFQNLPFMGINYYAPWARFVLELDAPDKTRSIHLTSKAWGPPSSVWNFEYELAPEGGTIGWSPWVSTSPWLIAEAFGDNLIWQENAGFLELKAMGSSLFLMKIELTAASNSAYQAVFVPEPSSLSLLLAGGAVLMAGRRRRC